MFFRFWKTDGIHGVDHLKRESFVCCCFSNIVYYSHHCILVLEMGVKLFLQNSYCSLFRVFVCSSFTGDFTVTISDINGVLKKKKKNSL